MCSAYFYYYQTCLKFPVPVRYERKKVKIVLFCDFFKLWNERAKRLILSFNGCVFCVKKKKERKKNRFITCIIKAPNWSLSCPVQFQSQGHHTINRLKEKGIERGSVRRFSFKGRERAIVSQTNMGTVSNATQWTLLRVGVGRIWAFLIAQIPSWTELSWTEVGSLKELAF